MLPFPIGLHVKICRRTWGVVTWESLLSLVFSASFPLPRSCFSLSSSPSLSPAFNSAFSHRLRCTTSRSFSVALADLDRPSLSCFLCHRSRLSAMMKWQFSLRCLSLSYNFFFLSRIYLLTSCNIYDAPISLSSIIAWEGEFTFTEMCNINFYIGYPFECPIFLSSSHYRCLSGDDSFLFLICHFFFL